MALGAELRHSREHKEGGLEQAMTGLRCRNGLQA